MATHLDRALELALARSDAREPERICPVCAFPNAAWRRLCEACEGVLEPGLTRDAGPARLQLGAPGTGAGAPPAPFRPQTPPALRPASPPPGSGIPDVTRLSDFGPMARSTSVRPRRAARALIALVAGFSAASLIALAASAYVLLARQDRGALTPAAPIPSPVLDIPVPSLGRLPILAQAAPAASPASGRHRAASIRRGALHARRGSARFRRRAAPRGGLLCRIFGIRC